MISLPKSMPARCSSIVEQHLTRKDVDAHRGHERLLGGVLRKAPPGGMLLSDLGQARARRLLLERDDLPVAVEPEDAHLRSRRRWSPAGPRW